MTEHEPNLQTCSNALLDMACRQYPFSHNLDKAKVRIAKNDRIFFGPDGDKSLYFPIDCLFSLRCSLRSGYTAEFSQIGRDGVVGINWLFGDEPGGSEAIALTAGYANKINCSIVKSAFEVSPHFRRTLLSYMEGHMRESAQRLTCSKHHSITEQLSRTLLMASDRLGSQEVGLTHEQLAVAIGCRREAVSISAGKLQSRGVIRYGYGKIAILDRAALEYASCECYRIIRDGFAKFLSADWVNRLPESGTE